MKHRHTIPRPAHITLACVRDMLTVMESYVPYSQRERARAEALAVGIGHADPSPPARYECPKCGAVSYNRNDMIERYCVRCHEFAAP
jgi:hypothetical protein